MSKGKEEMMDWLYQFVKSFGDQGIAIQDLSEKFDEYLKEEVAANEQIKDEIWQAFLSRDNVHLDGSEEEIGVMRGLELSDTLALGYGVRKVVVQPDSVDVEMVEEVEEVVEMSIEEESGKGATNVNDETAQSETSIDSRPLIPDISTPIQRSPEPKEQFIPVGNGLSFTRAGLSPEPRSGNKKSYKIADDPRGTQGSQRRLQSLLNAARAEADGFHTPNLVPALQINDGVKDVENTGFSTVESTQTLGINPRSHIQPPTATINSEISRPSPPTQSTDTIIVTNGQQHHHMENKIPKHLANSQLPSTPRSRPTVGYQYQSAPSNTPGENSQSSTFLKDDVDGIDYFAPEITRRGRAPGQRKRGRPKGHGRQVSPSSQVGGMSSPKDLSSMSFSSLAEVEEFQTPKPPQKKRGRPRGPAIKHKELINEPLPEISSEDPGETGLHITESGLRTSRRQPKPRQLFTPQSASPESEPKTVKTGKSGDPTTPSKPRRYREAIYTSYEDLLREEDDEKRKAGIDGVYINPLDAREGRSLTRKKTLVVLIKSQKLHDPDLLENRKGTWIEVLAERRKNLHDIAEAEAAKIAAATAAAAEEEKSKKRKRDGKSEAERSKRTKIADASPEKPSEVLSAEPENISEPSTAGPAESSQSSQAPNPELEKSLESSSTAPEKPSEFPNDEPEKKLEAPIIVPSEVLRVEPENVSELPPAGPVQSSQALNPEAEKPVETPSIEPEKPSEVPIAFEAPITEPAKPSEALIVEPVELLQVPIAFEAPITESAKPSEALIAEPAELLQVPITFGAPITESAKPSEALIAEPAELLQVPITFGAPITESAKPSEALIAEPAELLQVPNVESEKPLEVSSIELAKSSQAPSPEPANPIEAPSTQPPKSSEITDLQPDSFPSNEELALEFEKFKALSASKPSEVSNTNQDSFPSNEELALEFEKFKSGFTQQPSHDLTSELSGGSRSIIDPFVANSVQYEERATAWAYQRAPASTMNTQGAGPSSFFSTVYMNPMHPQSPQPQSQFSHPVSQYESSPYIRPQNTTFQNEARSSSIQPQLQPRWTESSESRQTPETVHNSFLPASNTNSYSSPYRVHSENDQGTGRHYQTPFQGNAAALTTPSPANKYMSPYEGKNQATPSFLALNPWLARNPAHIRSPVHQSPVQPRSIQHSPTPNSWPAGFLPPEPPKPQTQPKTEWPAGFLPPDALPSDVTPSSPMSIDSIRQFSPGSVSNASDPSMMAHMSQEDGSNRVTQYASPRAMSHSYLPQFPSITNSTSPHSGPANSTTNKQPQGLVGRENVLGQVVSSPLIQKINPMDSPSPIPDAALADSHALSPRLEIEEQPQPSSPHSIQVSPLSPRAPVSTQSVEKSQIEPVFHQTDSPKSMEPQPDQTLTKEATPVRLYRSPSVQSTSETAPEPKRRKISVAHIQETSSPQKSAATPSRLYRSPSVQSTSETAPEPKRRKISVAHIQETSSPQKSAATPGRLYRSPSVQPTSETAPEPMTRKLSVPNIQETSSPEKSAAMGLKLPEASSVTIQTTEKASPIAIQTETSIAIETSLPVATQAATPIAQPASIPAATPITQPASIQASTQIAQPAATQSATPTVTPTAQPAAIQTAQPAATQTTTPTVTPDDVEAFKKAETIQFEPVFARMSSIYNSVMGNLILSFDKTLLKFWSMDEEITDPIWTMQVWKMAENPIVSMPGSNPMELRLKEKKDDESIIVHRFLIAKTKEAHKSANEMRANLVTARIFVQMANPHIVQAEDPEVIATKPWKCEKCGARFKNKEGIKYHLSKSQTTCNPNFNPKTAKPRQYGRAKKETPKKDQVTKMKSNLLTSTEKEIQPERTDESSSEGGDSDDSVFEWAAKVVALKKSPKNRADRGDPVIGRNGKIYKALGGERRALLEIAEIVKKTPSLTEELEKIPPLPQTPDQSLPESVLPISKEKVVNDIILCLLRANNNALPGERGLWFAFVACWLKYYPTSKVLPEHKLFARALDELIEDGILSKTTFDFAGAKSRTIIRSILSDPRADAPSSADIDKLKKDMKAKHPDFYIPPGFSPPSVILDILIAIGKPAPLAPIELNDILGSDDAGKGNSSDDEFNPDVHALDAVDDLEDDPMDLDVDFDGFGNDFSPFPEYTTPQGLQFPTSDQQKLSKNNDGQMIKSRMRRPGQPLTLEERERRKRTTTLQEQTWTPEPIMLQNSSNGAWDVSSKPKPKRSYKLRERLPEPTTFMQDPSGSWSVRPFGHGVNPIFARPNKITVGNPQSENYLQKREDGHRPVIHPKKSVMLPSVPSKMFLNKNLQGDLISRPDGQIEISKATGLPKRHYTYRTRSQRDPEISRYTGLRKRAYRPRTPDPMDLTEASINGLTELDILNHYEAKPLEEEVGRQSNPGLASIPSFPSTPGLHHYFSNESAGLWDLAHPFVACTNVEKLKMQWLDRTAFTLETIPYSALEDNDDLPPEQETIIGTKRKRQQQKKEPFIGVRKGLKNKWVMPRRLASVPDDLLGVHRDVRYAADLLGTQMVNYDMNIRRKRQRFKEQGLAIDEEERLTMGIVVIRTMLGGLEMNIDWVILGSVFKDYSLNFLRKWWQVVWAKKKPMVEKLTKDFQATFIAGYRKGQVQSIDYDHIVDYDFNTLIDWALSKINTPTQEEKVFDLPNSFSELKKKYALVPEPQSNYWSEQYYYPLAAVYQRMNLVNSVPFTYPLQEDNPTYEIDDYALAKSWCRAAAVTPDHLWDSKAANKLLNRLPSAIIIKAREDLLKNKIITKNKRLRTNGRVYNLPDAFNAVFNRTGKIIYEKQYREAYDFKCELDQRFKNGETIVNIPWGVNEGSVMAITNLQANGCIYVQKSNIRANKFGLTEGGYETRLIDKAKYRFQMDITPTSNYIYNHAIPNLDSLSEPPSLGPRGAIPVWRSITGEVIEGMWRKVLLGVTGAFVLRSTIDIEGLERVFSPSLDAWEIKQLTGWGVERGVWQKCDYEGLGATAREASEMEGWEVSDWWWMIVGRYLVESDR
ncbi:hypothetical protein NHQ30_011396 [Ciborinia camelliae]|nr:hypothetical protein NHQ30_011396 [Ciborinia camelliae]